MVPVTAELNEVLNAALRRLATLLDPSSASNPQRIGTLENSVATLEADIAYLKKHLHLDEPPPSRLEDDPDTTPEPEA